MDKSTDDEIIAKLNAIDRSVGWAVLALVGTLVTLLAVFAGAFFTGHAALLQSEGVQIAVGILFAAAIFVLALRIGQRSQPQAYLESMEPRILRRRIDAHHRYWRWTLLSCIFTSFWSAMSLGHAFAHVGPDNRFWALLAGAMFIPVIALFSAMLIVGPGWISRDMHRILNDDFIRALRGRAERLGYAALMIAVAGALLVAIWRPALTLPVLSWALYAGFAIPALYYVIADWRAGRDG